MARTPVSPVQRSINVGYAVDALPALVQRAVVALTSYGPSDERTLKAWEAVEVHGATIHRQSRLLAGKSKGG